MKLVTLGSSSSGNGYILKALTGDVLIIEAGIKLSEVKKALDFDLARISGVIVSHSHNDHSGHIAEYQRAGIDSYMNEHVWQAKFGGQAIHNVNIIQPKTAYNIGPFKILPFDLKHDVPNYGYIIDHPESGLFCFITDTHYCPFRFPGLNNILIEANYSDKIIDRNIAEGKANAFVRNRVIMSHMEIDTTKDFLRANDLSKVNNIVLLHLSAGNSNAPLFQKEIQELTGKSVFVAEPSLCIDFNKTSF